MTLPLAVIRKSPCPAPARPCHAQTITETMIPPP
jgi:hypothetical protein